MVSVGCQTEHALCFDVKPGSKEVNQIRVAIWDANVRSDGTVLCARRGCGTAVKYWDPNRRSGATMGGIAWDAAHSIADVNGGTFCIWNLTVQCQDCNNRNGDADETAATLRPDWKAPERHYGEREAKRQHNYWKAASSL